MSPLKKGADWTSRDIILTQNKASITVNFWGTEAEKIEGMAVGSSVKIENLDTNLFLKQVVLKSTYESTVTVSEYIGIQCENKNIFGTIIDASVHCGCSH